jgi:hypothetical protein
MYGRDWEVNGTVISQSNDVLDVLNQLGEEGWQLAIKESNGSYILQRKIS